MKLNTECNKSSPLVSIITPCYNGERHLGRFLNSIITQTYKKIELIFVNDGSSDNTGKLVLSYKNQLEEAGIKFVYLEQENLGLGASINAGLQNVSGEYLCWPDADDYLEPQSVELRLRVLEDNPDYDIVSSDAFIRKESNPGNPVLASEGFDHNDDPNQFLHLITGKSFVCSGCYMVRTEVFFKTHPSGTIYPDRRGQNYQMLLPIYYNHKRYFLNKPLYNYIRHETSMSYIEAISTEEKLFAYSNQQKTMADTLANIPMDNSERERYLKLVDGRFSKIVFNIAFRLNDQKLLKEQYSILNESEMLTFRLKARYILFHLRKILHTSIVII